MYGSIGAPWSMACLKPLTSSQFHAGSLQLTPFVPQKCWGPATRSVGLVRITAATAALPGGLPPEDANAVATAAAAAARATARTRVRLIRPSLQGACRI